MDNVKHPGKKREESMSDEELSLYQLHSRYARRWGASFDLAAQLWHEMKGRYQDREEHLSALKNAVEQHVSSGAHQTHKEDEHNAEAIVDGGTHHVPRSYLLTWNPKRWPWADMEEDLQRFQQQGFLEMRWSCGNTKRLSPGDEVILVKLGERPKGVIGLGRAVDYPYEADHWDVEEQKTALYVFVRLELLEKEPIVSEAELLESPFSRHDWFPQKSGTEIDRSVFAKLRAKLLARSTGSMSSSEELFEGAARQITSNRYERRPAARAACIAHYGVRCYVCDMDFGEVYGEYAEGYIHVHHVVPLGAIGQEYSVDPQRDLKPLCPNCHAAIHLSAPILDPDELREQMQWQRMGSSNITLRPDRSSDDGNS